MKIGLDQCVVVAFLICSINMQYCNIGVVDVVSSVVVDVVDSK